MELFTDKFVIFEIEFVRELKQKTMEMITKDLVKEMYFAENGLTTAKEIEKLANELLNTTWIVHTFRFVDAKVINLRDIGWRFEFNSARRAAGMCSKGDRTIYISKWLLEQNLDKSLEFEDTLRHELAHAIDYTVRGMSNHDKIWKLIARQVLCNAERCYSTDVIQTKVVTKYTLICDNCGKEKASHKIKKRRTACGDCCRAHNFGRYTEKFVFRQVQNY